VAAIIKLVVPGELLHRPGAREKPSPAERKEKAVQPSAVGEPEQRLRKLSARSAWPKSEIIELFVLLLFLALALGATIDCFAELSRLLRSDAIEHVAARIANSR
jgi:hypothetical protein